MTTTCALPPAPRALQAGGAGMYFQNYNPAGNVFLSTLLAAVPILVLLYFIALHPHRDKRGIRRLGVAAPYAAFYGVLAAFLVSCLVFRMPIVSAVSAFVLGSLSGFLGIIWIVVAAMFLYTMTVITGKIFLISRVARSTALSMPRLRAIGFAPAATVFTPSRKMACASTVAVVVPSPATSLVFEAPSRTICAPIFSVASFSSISFATVTPSFVIVGLPYFLSRTTLRPFGPRVIFTASAS